MEDPKGFGEEEQPCCYGAAFGPAVEIVLVWIGDPPNRKYAYVPKRIVDRALRIKFRAGAPEGDKVAHE